MNFTLVNGDITKSKSDIIVNSLGTHANIPGKICENIIKAAGSVELLNYINSLGERKELEIFVTDSYNMPSKKIIHIVMPYKWNDPECTELYKAYKLVIDKAIELNAKSLAIPFMGTGYNEYNPKEVYDVFSKLMKEYYDSKINMDIQFAVLSNQEASNAKNINSEKEERIERGRHSSIQTCSNSTDYNYNHKKIEYSSDSKDVINRKQELADLLNYNKIFVDYNIEDVIDPRIYDDDIKPTYNFLMRVLENKGISMKQFYESSSGYILKNDISRMKYGKVNISREMIYKCAILAKMNRTEALIFMAMAGFCFRKNEKEDRVFHKYLKNGEFPEKVYDFYLEVDPKDQRALAAKAMK